ncbi:MAG: hypothetical protein U9Q16_00725 [Patescibacteria group bacterium]|nr:hypothetical protein [Patescibacteria group bacterium]
MKIHNKDQKGISSSFGILIIVIVAILAVGGVLAYQYMWNVDEPEKTPVQISKTKYINIFLYNDPENNFNPDKADRYLVAVKVELDSNIYSVEDKIFYSLSKLFEIDEYKYGQSGYENLLYASDLKVKEISKSNEKFIIDLEGEIVGIGSLADILIQRQITKIIEQYSNNYEIKLNNSEKEWRCSLDNSDLCE